MVEGQKLAAMVEGQKQELEIGVRALRGPGADAGDDRAALVGDRGRERAQRVAAREVPQLHERLALELVAEQGAHAGAHSVPALARASGAAPASLVSLNGTGALAGCAALPRLALNHVTSSRGGARA